jgi:hypothetical protein
MNRSFLRRTLGMSALALGLGLGACTHEAGSEGSLSPFPAPAPADVVPAASATPPSVAPAASGTPPPSLVPAASTTPPSVAPAAASTTPPSVAPVASATSPATPVSQCTLKGSQPPAKGTQLHDAVKDGRLIAEFSGAMVPLQMSEIPLDPTTGRARLVTSNGTPNVRLEGYVPATAMVVYSAKDVPVAAGHVWISDGQKVKLSKGQTSQLSAEITVAGSQNQVVTGTGPCESFALEKGTVSTFTVPGDGRGYQMKTASLDLYDDANGSVIFTLSMLEGTGQLFWSVESKAGFVRLQMRGDIAVDAWAKWSALSPLKKGEMVDQTLASSQTVISGATLALDKTPAVQKATKDIPIRARRDEKEKTIGVIETGAEFYVTETITGWSNILPKHLGMTAPADGGFWILSSDVPK